jgi:hypothetical protein
MKSAALFEKKVNGTLLQSRKARYGQFTNSGSSLEK